MEAQGTRQKAGLKRPTGAQLLFAAGAALFAAMAGLITYYILVSGVTEMHADCIDTLYWAEATARSGRLFDPNFSYACLLPFGGHWFMVPFVLMFGFSLRAQACGMLLFFIVFTAALFFLFATLRFSWTQRFFAVAGILGMLSFSVKLREIFWQHIIYYSLGTLFLVLGLALLIRLLPALDGAKFTARGWVDFSLLLVLLFLCAANGISGVALFNLPIVGALAMMRFFDVSTPLLAPRNRRYLGAVAGMGGITLLGIIVNKIVCAPYSAAYADSFSVFSSTDTWVTNAQSLISHFCNLFGVSAQQELRILSTQGVITMISLVMILLILVIPFVMLFLLKRIGDTAVTLLVVSHWVLSAGVLFGYICGTLSVASWRLTPLVASAVLVCAVFLRYVFGVVSLRRIGAVCACFALFACLVSAGSYYKTARAYRAYQAQTQMEDFLLEHDLHQGYADFWYSGLWTVRSNSAVTVRSVILSDAANDPNVVLIYYYQTNSGWYTDAAVPGRCFLALSEADYAFVQAQKWAKLDAVSEVLTFQDMTILVFDENIF